MASQENEKAMDGLLRRSLARDEAASASKKGECPTPDLLAAYYDLSLGATDAAEYELHFSQCTRCREQLAMMVRAEAEHHADVVRETELVTARAPVELSVAGSRGAARAAQSRASAELKRHPSRLREIRWLVPVAAALILSTFIFMRFASRGTNVDLGNQVAMSTPAPKPQDQQNAFALTPAEAVAAKKSSEAKSAAEANKTTRSTASARPTATPAASPPTHASRTTSMASRPGGFSRSNVRGGSMAVTSPTRSSAPEPAAAEPAPSAPPPELNTALSAIPVAADSAVAVQSPAPPAPAAQPHTSTKFAINGLATSGRSAHSAAGKSGATKPKSTGESSTSLVIGTPDLNVLYRVVGGGMVEHSEDGGVTWQGQLLNSSAEFSAGSCPATNVCWLVGRAGVIFLTADGKNWRSIFAPAATDFISIEAKDALSAALTASDGRKWSTEDGGMTWRPAN